MDYPEHYSVSKRSSWEFFNSLFIVAGIEVLGHWELANAYWPDSYVQLRTENPWWLVKTSVGMIKIGRRKRVMSIDWSDTPIRHILTDDDTTKDPAYVHAWTDLKAVEYLTAFQEQIKLHFEALKYEENYVADPSPQNAYLYARFALKKPTNETRIIACKEPDYALRYAEHVDKCPRNETRTAACKVSGNAYFYARDVDKSICDEIRQAVKGSFSEKALNMLEEKFQNPDSTV